METIFRLYAKAFPRIQRRTYTITMLFVLLALTAFVAMQDGLSRDGRQIGLYILATAYVWPSLCRLRDAFPKGLSLLVLIGLMWIPGSFLIGMLMPTHKVYPDSYADQWARTIAAIEQAQREGKDGSEVANAML